MSVLRRIAAGLGAVFHQRRVEAELDEELRDYLETSAAGKVKAGMSREEALRAARMEMGRLENVKENVREVGWENWLETLWRDLHHGFRMIRRNPGFSALALLCLTIGIGANTAVFSWIEGILLRPYPAVAHQERMVALAGTNRGTSGLSGVSTPDLQDLQKSCTLFDWFLTDRIVGVTLSTTADRAEVLPGSVVSPDYFENLGVRPILGRGFESSEGAGRNAHSVTVISYQIWQERYGGDPGIVGKTQVLNGVPHTIIGVAPPGFYGTFVGYSVRFWVPASMQERFDPGGYKLEDRGARWIEGFARLKPGVTLPQAQEEISAVMARLEAAYPATNRGRGVRLYALWRTPFNGASTLLPALGVSLGVVVFVLLIACANVSNLLLLRSFGRRHEMTVRLAIGAGRGRLIRQLLTESLILSALATLAGFFAAYWCRTALVLLVPRKGLYLPAELDWRVLAVSAGVALASTLLFALIPAMQASRVDLAGTLKSESGGVVGGGGRTWVRSSLVTVQVGLSFVLLVGAGLLLHSMQALRKADPGFTTEGVLAAGIDLVSAGYDEGRAKNFEDALIDRLQVIPGVESAAFARNVPFTVRSYSSSPIVVDGYVAPPDQQPVVDYDEVGPGYFKTLGISLASGREFTRADNETARLVAIVNETMAEQFWPGQDPVGRRMQVKGRWLSVVGVAKDSKVSSFVEAPAPFFYVPLRENFAGAVMVLIRVPRNASMVAGGLGREVRALDSNVAPTGVITMRQQVESTTSSQRIGASLLGVFGAIATLLAAIGLYGVMSYTVSQSTRELGLRMALGASATSVLRLVMSRGLALAAGGVALGAAAALGTTRLLGYLLYQVSPRDPLAFGSALLVMTIAMVTACLLPAWRAARTDPVRALKS